ncbi:MULTISPECIES: potassium-transporting ATPase subunit KdpA [Pseudomonadota]|jgi:K+-transporting ATPase ATPase A chain|uniref:potassium-transporting ATPase subunit KdpA n=1 Tax=Pseudomonadota TaxID=1224 RepID=UPI000769BD42|nr:MULTISPECIES: potassium-transporting ATPase subunit KdpA [Pseudomonadota]MAF60029.1 potassium-transporting ATPase subunit A [Blastomonas sp.]|tara:strand:+ start:50222 stop:51880 length:1659 start_codon:yes stop_codon:yes gene_type:complete
MLASLLTVAIVVGGSILLSWPLGRYMAALFSGRFASADGTFAKLGGSSADQDGKAYSIALLAFNAVMFAFVFALLSLQHLLPLNPDGQGPASIHLIFNTTASFVTNTNLQHYSGESTWSYLAQLAGLMWLQFVSAATGIAALAALARGIGGQKSMGNFFIDLQRASFGVLLPLAIAVALVLAISGVPMTFNGAAEVTTLEGAVQTIARGPAAAFVAIKQLGTNGGGFFGPNSTHPLENPTFWANLVEMASLILIPMACVWMFGRMIGRTKHAVVIFGVMAALLLVKITAVMAFESTPTQAFAQLPVVQDVGNLEGKELRLGATTGPLWAALTTSTSNGSVGAMHDSLNPLAGLVPMAGMWLNETFGGVGVGMINMFLYIVVAVFVAGMMVGRTPEYLGHRIEGREMRLAVLALISHPLLILGGTALFAATPWGTDTLANVGAHGFSEILYEFSSSAANNGSGFEGLGDNTGPWNWATGIVMLIARFLPILVPLAIVGSLMSKRRSAESAGTLSVESSTFGIMLLITILIFGALTFLPAAALGPIAEHVTLMR